MSYFKSSYFSFLVLYFFCSSCIHEAKPLIHETRLLALKKHKSSKIPKKIHQIWVGGYTPPEYYYLFLKSFKENAPDYEHKLWTNKDLTRENFPLIYDHVLKLIDIGIKKYGRNENNWKGIPSRNLPALADMMRLEILYHHGGYYFDVKSELLKPFEGNLPQGDFSFIVANQDPCGLKCVSNTGPYLANAFMAGAPGNPIVETLLKKENLDQIDFESKRVDLESGPGYFAKAFPKEVKENPSEYGVLVLNNKLIFPLIDWMSSYQFPQKNLCMSPDKSELEERSKGPIRSFEYKGRTLYTIFPCDQYPNSISICHWGYLGKTWHK